MTYVDDSIKESDNPVIERVSVLASSLWDGLYMVRRAHDDVWRVTLHAPNGPVHFVCESGGLHCHQSHGCGEPCRAHFPNGVK